MTFHELLRGEIAMPQRQRETSDFIRRKLKNKRVPETDLHSLFQGSYTDCQQCSHESNIESTLGVALRGNTHTHQNSILSTSTHMSHGGCASPYQYVQH